MILPDQINGNALDPKLLLPFLLLPKIRTFYTSILNTAQRCLILNKNERTQWSGKSAVTEMIFDFVRVDGFAMDSLLRLPSAPEKLTLNFYAALPSEQAYRPGFYHPMCAFLFASRIMWCAVRHQRHSLRTLTIRGANSRMERAFPSLKPFAVLKELTTPLTMLLHHGKGSRRSLAGAIPAAIERLELLAYNHFPVRTWQLEFLGLLNDKEAAAPRLRQVVIEHWMAVPDGPVSRYELDGEAVTGLGRQVGVEVLVDFVEYRVPDPSLSDTEREDDD